MSGDIFQWLDTYIESGMDYNSTTDAEIYLEDQQTIVDKFKELVQKCIDKIKEIYTKIMIRLREYQFEKLVQEVMTKRVTDLVEFFDAEGCKDYIEELTKVMAQGVVELEREYHSYELGDKDDVDRVIGDMEDIANEYAEKITEITKDHDDDLAELIEYDIQSLITEVRQSEKIIQILQSNYNKNYEMSIKKLQELNSRKIDDSDMLAVTRAYTAAATRMFGEHSRIVAATTAKWYSTARRLLSGIGEKGKSEEK